MRHINKADVKHHTVSPSEPELLCAEQRVGLVTYVLVGGLVEGDQVGVEARQSHHRPQGEEADQHLQHRAAAVKKTAADVCGHSLNS